MHILFDIGGTNTRVTVSKDGIAFETPTKYPTPQNFHEGVTKLKETINSYVTNSSDIQSIIGGMPGILEKESKTLTFARNLPGWEGKSLKEALKKDFVCPILLENDAALAGLGEAVYGAGRGADIVGFITISTGLGGVKIVGEQIDPASVGYEPGHELIRGQELETLVSGSAFTAKYGKEPHDITDEKIWDEAAKILAEGLQNAIVFWSPERIVLGGPMILKKPGIDIEKVREYLSKNLTFEKLPELVLAKNGDTAGLYGALALSRANVHTV
jgi:predicted NBD/HSP70 family sugar kinase